MSLLDDEIKKLEEFSTITPRIAYLFKRLILEVTELAEEQEMDAWSDISEAHDLECDLVLAQLHKNLESLSPEQWIKEVAPFANITLRAIELLHCSQLNLLNAAETDELYAWREESEANASLEERLDEFNYNNSIRETTRILMEIFIQAHPQDTRAHQVLQWLNRITTIARFTIKYDPAPLPR